MSRNWTTLRKLGEGHFGVTYLVKRHLDGAEVVVKKQPRNLPHAEKEARVMQNLVHPYIVRMLECVCDDRFRTIVMEYCNGGDLRAAIKTRSLEGKPGFPEDSIRRWVAQLAYALYYCHVQHVLHRDLKAENVMLHDDQIKIVDFGLSRVLGGTSDFARTKLGTPAYVPPEIIAASPYNSRVDMWSLGVLLFELMTLRRPFDGNTLEQLFSSISHDPMPSLDGVAYSDELKTLVRSLLDKNPMARPSSADLLQLRWVQDNLDVALQVSDGRSRRELRAWRKVRVSAALEKSRMMEFCRSMLSVACREEPSMQSTRLGIISEGEVVEEACRVTEGHITWMKLYPRGYCVANDPSRGTPLFREIADWRVIRPQSRVPSPEPEEACDDALPVKTVPEPSKTDPGDAQFASDLVAATFAPEPPDDDTDLLPLWSFLYDRLTHELVQELLQEHQLSARPCDDTSWTIYVSDRLRPLGRLACLPVLRAIGMRARKRQALEVGAG